MEIDLKFLERRPISYSSLKQFKKSPLHYMKYLTAKFKPTPALVFGSVVDCLLLTPDVFNDKFIIANFNPYTKDGKTTFEDYYKKGITMVNDNDYERAKLAVHSVKTNIISKQIYDKITQTQRELRWTDLETDIPLISYLDADFDDEVVELKTAQSADPLAFQRDSYNYDYPLQAAMYNMGYLHCKGKRPKKYRYIVVETSEPFGVSVYKPTEEYFEYGAQELRRLLTEFRSCLDFKMFGSGYEYRSKEDGYFNLDLPAWAHKKA